MPGPSTSSDAVQPAARSSALDREAVEFLSRRILPGLRSETHQPLASALRAAAKAGRLGGLSSLPERQRRELLEVIERRLDRAPEAAPPRVVVRLTSVISGVPSQERETRRLAAPAR